MPYNNFGIMKGAKRFEVLLNYNFHTVYSDIKSKDKYDLKRKSNLTFNEVTKVSWRNSF